MRKKYLNSEELERILMLTSSNGGSSTWKFLWKCRHLITKHISWKIGNGRKAKFLIDSWDGEDAIINAFYNSDWIKDVV